MQIIEAGTKLEIIIKVLDAVTGWAIIDRKDGSYVAVEKGRESCRHRDTDHCKHCDDPVNVPCSKWEVDESLLETGGDPRVCEGCIIVYDAALPECPVCTESKGIAEHLVKCDLSGSNAACVNCGHGGNHAPLNGCNTISYDYCKHINRTVKCVPIKEVYLNG